MAQQVEKKLMNEWLDLNFPAWITLKNQRIGAVVPPGKPGEVISFEEKYAKGFRRYADVILTDGNSVKIIEFDVRAKAEGPAALELYNRLLPDTVELTTLKNKPIELIYVVAFPDPVIEAVCKEKGIVYIVYQPDWIKTYWTEKMALAEGE